MQNHFAETVPSDKTARQQLLASLRRVLTVWLIGFVLVLLATYFIDKSLMTAALIISVVSGLIAVTAICPLAWFGNTASDSRANSPADSPVGASGDFVSAFMLGTVLRLFGTVALFLLCRYQMGQQPEAIAVLVGGWYVLLTTVEVVSLAKTTSGKHGSRNNRQIWTTG